MKTAHMVAIGAGVLGVGAIFLFTRKSSALGLSSSFLPGVSVKETEADRQAKELAALRSAVGAKASTGASAGFASMLTSMASQAGGSLMGGPVGAAAADRAKELDKYVPGASNMVGQLASQVSAQNVASAVKYVGSAAKSAGSTAVSAIRKLKFW